MKQTKKSKNDLIEKLKGDPNVPIHKKWYFWVGIIAVFLVIGGIYSSANPEPEKTDTKEDKSLTQKTEEPKVDEQLAFDKCVVMEAADIRMVERDLPASAKTKNEFDEAAKSCFAWFTKDFDSFYAVGEADWAERKNEVIEGETLEQVLEIYRQNEKRVMWY